MFFKLLTVIHPSKSLPASVKKEGKIENESQMTGKFEM